MFSHYTNQNSSSSSRRLTSSDRLVNDAYFNQYEGGAPGRAATSMSSVGHHGHARSASDFSYLSHQQYLMEEEDEEPMDILYEQEIDRLHVRHLSVNVEEVTNLELQMTDAADHLMALLQREANDYSVPLPVRYYPTEFADVDSAEGENDAEKSSSKKTTIGPWRKRIASWMYDVVDHFQYDRNVVSIALRYIDQYVAHLLVENQRAHRRGDSGIGASRGSSSNSSSQPVKRRHFQLIAVTSLYLAIKVHGELMENDPVSGAEYDVVASLVDEVDGRAFLGRPNDDIENEQDDDSSQESNDELLAVSNKLSDLKRRQRKGRWSSRLSQFGLPLVHPGSNNSSSFSSGAKQPKRPHSNLPYKPRKRGMLSGPLRLHSFVELSRGLFTARDITDTEKKILVALNYIVNPPTSRRFVGEMLRLLALCFCGAVDGHTVDAEATASAAERMLGLERKEILAKVLNNACAQIEGAASVPSLSIGCLPSVVAYGAIVNAVEEEFEKLVADGNKDKNNTMEMEKNSPQLEDFQRHYRRYSRNQSPTPSATSNLESDRELFLEAWKDQFLTTVFHATNCFLSPDSQDILGVRELLLDNANDTEDAAATNSPSGTASPTEKSEKKRSPRSPRSVIIGNASPMSRHIRGSSFFARQSSSSSKLLSPYDSRGRTASASSVLGNSFRSLSSSVAATSSHPHRAYYKQTSEPIAEDSMSASANGRFARAQTPEVSHFRNYDSRQRMSSGNFEGSWRTNSEAFQPPNPNPPFFSA